MKHIIFSLFSCILSISLSAQNYWQQQVDHYIDVKLDDSARTLDGFTRINYTNNSPDTLHFIWFHIWPNAYKNDRTAFSEQRLKNGRTDFYFATANQRGYINRLNFTQDNEVLKIEDHPNHQDIIKVYLDRPLAPSQTTIISTPFHVKLPKRFSRSGYTKDDIAVTQWYPKPAVYDRTGWHPMPYLENGEYFSEFGNYTVTITSTKEQIIASSGKLVAVNNEGNISTYTYELNHATDFAWFTSKKYITDKDTIQLKNGKVIDVAAYYFEKDTANWKHVIQYAKDAVHFRSETIGEYPFETITVVRGLDQFAGGMEYPSITLLSGSIAGPMLDYIVEHEIGHNWFQASLASNEREHPWMDEGLNTFFDDKYFIKKYGSKSKIPGNMGGDVDLMELSVDLFNSLGTGQPIETPSEDLTLINYSVIPYQKTARWLKIIENNVGEDALSSSLKKYYGEWKGKHPYPSDLKKNLEQYTNKPMDSVFALLNNPSPLNEHQNLKTKLTFGAGIKHTDKYRYIGILPAFGFNRYDKFMLGAIIHNYNVRNPDLNFMLAPLYATGSKKLNGLARINYHKPESNWSVGMDLMSFSKRAAFDTLNNKLFERFSRVSGYARYYLPQANTSSVRRFFEWKTFLFSEKDFTSFTPKLSDTVSYIIYADKSTASRRFLNQLSFIYQDNRVLYPYDYVFQLQQGSGFYKLNVTGNYFFNYRNSGGLSLRFFAAKFGYLGNSLKNSAAAYRYMPKLMGNTGEEDYTYSNYFLGRTATYASSDESIENAGFAAQQIMIRDGGMKMRLDYFEFLQGRSDNWLAAINLNTTLPSKMFPVKLPLKLFLDAGTSAPYWKDNYEGPKFLYVGGLQLSLLRNIVNIYAPLVYSKEIKDNLQSIPELNTFSKRLTFSIDIQRINFRKISGNQIPL